MRAWYRPMWQDELYTWNIARLPGARAIWDVLHAGADQNLPLSHLSVRVSHSLFGPGELATRLPALTGFWIMLLCLYVFLRRRLPLPYALVGTLFPMLTFAWQYAFEARAYGILLGCAAAALLAWQTAAEDRMRPVALALLALALAVALGSHYGALQLAIPLGAGEIVRSLHRRRVDVPVWIAFGAASLVTLMYPGLLAPTANWDLHGLQPTVSAIGGFYGAAFRTAVAPLIAGAVAVYVAGRDRVTPGSGELKLPVHETAALVGFVLAPGVYFMTGLASNHFVFANRHGVLVVIGAAGWAAILLFRLMAASRRAGTVFVLSIAGWLALSRAKEALAERRPPAVQVAQENPLLARALADGRPVVIANQQLLMQADHYLPAEAGRAWYLMDWDAGRHYLEQDEANQLTSRAARYLPLKAHVELFDRFTQRNPHFLLHTDERFQQWLYDLLLRRGWKLTVLSRIGAESLIEVSAP
jgi:Dolichyl-phosphate-mannose-protein mannosyltransferase